MRSFRLRLDLEALRRLDVFEIDAAEGRLERRHHVDDALDLVRASISMSNTSMPANFLNSTALPSITGLAASGPILPRPSTAVPFEITATRLAAGRQLGGLGRDPRRSPRRRRRRPGE